MVQFIKLALLSAVLAVTAFGLENGSGFRNGISHSPLKLPEHLATTFSRGGKHDFKTPSSSPTFISNSPNLNTNSNIAKPESSGISSSLWNDNTKIPIFMTVWFAGNMFYNEWNKKACTALGKSADGMSNLHWTLSAVQLLVGVLFVVPMWLTGLRQAPQMSFDNWKELAPVGFCTCLSHAFSVLSMAVGAVSFGQIVKSAEPVFAAATNAAILKDFDHPYVYAALLPIIGGVSLASLKELSFSTTALLAASAANQAAAFKNVVSKGVMKKSWAKQLGPQNLFAAVTILAFLSTVPFALYFEWNQILPVYEQLVKTGKLEVAVKNAVLSGLAFYIYNEAAFLALDKLSPVTHSVANTVKRVAVIVYTCFVFNTPMSTMGAVGSGIAVAGTLLYSLVKQKFSKHASGHGHGSAATSASQVPPGAVNGKKQN